ncbi:MAG: hypothetical protein JXR97_16860, partial [Planctomycetes bacterium]|nr:hypothetical protein [Planctomycetota bacterium]
LFNVEAFRTLLEKGEGNLSKDVLFGATEGFCVEAFPFDGYWEDVGTVERFYRANMEWRSGKGLVEMFTGEDSIITHSRRLPPTRIDGTLLEDSVVAAGSQILANRVSRSIIGIRSRIGDNAIIEDSIIMGNDKVDGEASGIGADTCIRKAIIDKDVVIGRGTKILNKANVMEADHENYVIRSGIVVIPRGVVLPPETVI